MLFLPFLLFLGCQPSIDVRPTPGAAPIFLDGAVLVDRPVPGSRPVGGARHLATSPWSPSATWELGGQAWPTPAQPTCVALFSVELGDVRRWIAAGGGPPDVSVAFSPDGERLAVGTWRGDVLVLDAWTGEVLVRRHLAETMVKQVVWSTDGTTLLASEQSPDAWVHGLDPLTLADRWQLRLADEVGSSPPPAGDDLYGAYQLPAATGLIPLPDGGLLVAAAHGWPGPDGRRLNLTRLMRLDAQGRMQRAWPETAGPFIIQALRVDLQARRVALAVNRTADDPTNSPSPPHAADLPPGLVLLDLDGLTLQRVIPPPPPAPGFTDAWIWDALVLHGEHLIAGYGDGRLYAWDAATGAPRWTAEPGGVIRAGGAPIAAPVGFAAASGPLTITVTGETTIPWGAAAPEARPPSPHPGANRVQAWDGGGSPVWSWQAHALGYAPAGLSVASDGRIGVGLGPVSGSEASDRYGIARLTAGQEEPVICRTAGPIFFRHALQADGRLAVAELPRLTASGDVVGAWRVTVLR